MAEELLSVSPADREILLSGRKTRHPGQPTINFLKRDVYFAQLPGNTWTTQETGTLAEQTTKQTDEAGLVAKR